VLRDQMNRLAAQGSATLGISFLVGLVISLWSANSGIKALFDGLNVVYEEKEKRSFIGLNALFKTRDEADLSQNAVIRQNKSRSCESHNHRLHFLDGHRFFRLMLCKYYVTDNLFD
jgi:hypothetical protein